MTSVRDIMREPAKPKRNFLLENKGHIHKIEQQIRGKKYDTKDVHPKNHKYANVKSKVHTSLNKGLAKQPSVKSIVRSEDFGHPSWYPESSKSVCDEAVQVNHSVPRRHQGTQTSDEPCDGKILSPSQRPWRSLSVESLNLEEDFANYDLMDQGTQRSHHSAENSASSCPDELPLKTTLRSHTSAVNDNSDIFQMGDNIVWPTNKTSLSKTTEKSAEDCLRAPTTYQRGVVPRYIRERQEEQVREAERILKSAPDPLCPPGHRKLEEQERLDSLASLKATQADLIVKLNKLPVHQDTLRSQNLRKQIDQELNKVEHLITAFSKIKVFVEI